MLKRIISGICLVIITAPALYFGGWFLYALCLFISLVGNYELLRVAGLEKSPLGICAYVSTVVYYILLDSADNRYSMLVIVAAFLAMMTIYVFTFPKYKAENIMWSFFGIIYVTMMLAYIYETRRLDNGVYLVWLIFVSSWGNDTFAYFTGVLIGKHKMAPILSPKKSIEGAIGGIVGATALGVIYGSIVSTKMTEELVSPMLTFAVASCIGAMLAIVGDLAASAIKRNYNVKDYGKLIPGHGGILDRFDSVIFTAPVVYWAVVIINGLVR
ncbi:MAG: phosphatidate cytidylyltransferase [Lachnospira sp.]